MYYGSFPRKLEMFLEQLSLLIVITPPPLPHSYKNAFPDGDIGDIRTTHMKHSDTLQSRISGKRAKELNPAGV